MSANVRAMRALSIGTVFFGVPWVAGYAAIPPLIEIPVTISQGTSVRVPFSVTQSGTYDLELQYPAGVEMYYNSILDRKLRRELAGTVTLSCDARTLKHNLPTGWGQSTSWARDHSHRSVPSGHAEKICLFTAHEACSARTPS